MESVCNVGKDKAAARKTWETSQFIDSGLAGYRIPSWEKTHDCKRWLSGACSRCNSHPRTGIRQTKRPIISVIFITKWLWDKAHY